MRTTRLMRNSAALLLISLACTALSASDSFTVKAPTAKGNGREAHFTGGVTFCSEAGTMTACEALLLSSRRGKNIEGEGRQLVIKLLGDVAIEFNDGAKLRCSEAEFDFATQRAQCISTGDSPTVEYSCANNGDLDAEVASLKCRHLDIFLAKRGKEAKLKLHCEKLIATGEVLMENGSGAILTAERLTLPFAAVGDKVQPSQWLLEGSVTLYNRQQQKNMSGAELLHYGLADKATFTPSDRELLLEAEKGGRVLFYDKINNAKISAPALRLTRDKTTDRELIKGIGDVRMSFLDEELKQLKERFADWQ